MGAGGEERKREVLSDANVTERSRFLVANYRKKHAEP